jgi:hypothetical protein
LLISDSSLTQEPNQEESETDTAGSGEDENEGESEGEQTIPRYSINPRIQILLGII